MAGSAIQKFYIFVQAKGGWGGIVNAADTNTRYGDNDGIVSKGELNSYLKDNYVDYDMYDFETIWANIDTIQTGKIENTNLEDLGRIDDKEISNINNKADDYGQLITVIEDMIDGMSIDLDHTGISSEDLIYQIATLLLENNNNDINAAISAVNSNFVNDYVVPALKTLMTNKCIKEYKDRVRDLINFDNSRYDLADDTKLTELINNYLNAELNESSLSQLSNINEYVKHIIEAYLSTAGIGECPPDVDPQYQYANGDHDSQELLNDLQKAKLYTEYTKALKTNKLLNALKDSGVDCEAFSGLLSKIVKDYIDDLKTNVWSQMTQEQLYNQFNDGLNWLNESNIQGDFLSSPAGSNFLNLVAIGGLGEDITDYIDGTGPYADGNGLQQGEEDLGYTYYDWKNYYGENNEPKRFVAMMYYFGGFGGLAPEAMSQLFNDRNFQDWLNKAYLDIMNNPSDYGIDDLITCTQAEMQNALLRYFKDHLEDILYDCRFSDYEIAYALSNSALNTCTLISNGNYGTYTIEDVKEYVDKFIEFVESSKYGSNSGVITAISELKNYKDGITAPINGEELNKYLKAVTDAIEKASAPAPTGGDGGDTMSVEAICNGFSWDSSNTDESIYEQFRNYLYEYLPQDIVDQCWEYACADLDSGFKFPDFKNKFLNYLKSLYLEDTEGLGVIKVFNCNFNTWKGLAGYDIDLDSDPDITNLNVNSNTIFGKIYQYGLMSYNIKAKSDPNKALSAFKEFLEYYKTALESLYELEWGTRDRGDGGLQGNGQIYVKRKDLQKKFDDWGDFGDDVRGKSPSGIYIGADSNESKRYSSRSFYVYIDYAQVSAKFKEFYNAA